MTDFLTTLKELREKATAGPWRPDEVETRSDCWAVCGEDNICDMFYLREDDHTRMEFPNGEANARLICLLVNHAHLIVEMVEEAKHLAKLTRHLQERPDDDSREVRVPLRQLFQMRTILSKLNGDVA